MILRARPALACRTLQPSAAARCSALHRQSFAAPWSVAEFEKLLTSKGVFADGIGADQAISAFILSRQAADEAEILTVASDPAIRGRGYSGPLLGYHLSRLAQAGVTQVFLEVDEHNRPALALYRRHGFVEVGKRTGYYARPDGARATALILRRSL